MFSSVQHIHFVGIGGIGMSGIAEILLSQGFKVSGSDLSKSDVTEGLAAKGAVIYLGHSAENVTGAEVVVYSSAVKPDQNPETRAAIEQNIPMLRRAEMLAEVSRLNYCLAIAGTHGKTTTTSLCGLALMNGSFDPTVIVGGKLSGFGGTNARLGKGKWTVVEADEYDRSFLQLSPTIAVLTNVEAEHLDIYGTYDEVKKAFIEFANKVPFYGFAVVCLDDAGVKEILSSIQKKVITYGESRHAMVRVANIRYKEHTSTFDVLKNGELCGEVTINVPGLYNILNALASIAVGLEMGIPFASLQKAMQDFAGVYRRFEKKGTANSVTVIDDYAHHPSEVKATLKGARTGWPTNRIIAAFQPHTFTRTRDFYADFGKSFDDADIVIITDVYPARELPIEGVDGELIANATKKYGHSNVYYVQNKAEITALLIELAKPNDIIVTMGAGDIWKSGVEYLQHFQK